MRVDTICRSLPSTIYSSNIISKRVTEFFKPKASKSREQVNINLQNASVEQENVPHLNEAKWRGCLQNGNFSIHQNITFSQKQE